LTLLIVAVIFAASFALWRRVRASRTEPDLRNTFRVLGGLSAAAILLMVRVTAPLWLWLPKLRFVQFPWRWLAVLAVTFALFSTCSLKRRTLVPAWIALVLLLAVTGSFLVRHAWWDAEDVNFIKDAVGSKTGFEGTDEYDPVGDDRTDLPQR